MARTPEQLAARRAHYHAHKTLKGRPKKTPEEKRAAGIARYHATKVLKGRPKMTVEAKRIADRTKCVKWRAAHPGRHAEATRKYRAANREKRLAQRREWYAKNKEGAKAYQRQYTAARPEWARAKKRRASLARYGLSVADVEQMLQAQQGRCAICTRELGISYGGTGKMAIDHCHTTGRNRAILCGCCNTGIGQFLESTEILQRAIDYLVKHGAVARSPQQRTLDSDSDLQPQLPLFH